MLAGTAAILELELDLLSKENHSKMHSKHLNKEHRMIEPMTSEDMIEMAATFKANGRNSSATLKIPLFTVGALIRPAFRSFLMEIEIAGGTVDYKENKRWASSDFYNIRISGSSPVMERVALSFADILKD